MVQVRRRERASLRPREGMWARRRDSLLKGATSTMLWYDDMRRSSETQSESEEASAEAANSLVSYGSDVHEGTREIEGNCRTSSGGNLCLEAEK